ncbi:MAG TPA: glycosyltransferase [Candidatus Moranbacteria bacterium]|nr:glycosyltransferase [Candidatus Moranbacteria bacterium]
MLAPIVLFVYNRPWHTRKTLESLETNALAKESELFIFADGPKENASQEQLKKITETRKIIREKNWCNNVTIVEKDANMGLANSVIAGVTEIVNKFGKVIVLEDDLLISKNFLRYMNDALDRYENEEKVMQISGYMFPTKILTKNDAFFLPFTTSWGWGTWKRAWDCFDPEMKGLETIKNNENLQKKFDLNDSYPYYKMLLNQKSNQIDSWAIRFYLSVFLKDGLTLYPKKTLVKNIGFDGSGVHCKNGMSQEKINDSFVIESFSDDVVMDEVAKIEIIYFFRKQNIFFKKLARIINENFRKIC